MDLIGSDLDFVLNHVFLPPMLPNREEEDLCKKELSLLCLVQSLAEQFAEQATEYSAQWQPILAMLRTWVDTNRHGDVSKEALDMALKSLKVDGFIALHIRAQNSGVIIRKTSDDSITFDAFEASCSNDSVLAAQGRLIRQFPGRSVAFPADLIQNDSLRGHIAQSLQQMSVERIPECMPKTVKASSEVPEERDTIHPGFVTENFMSMLEAVGGASQVIVLQKHIRDDIIWNNSQIPWRRSPLWLVLRVALQSALRSAFPDDTLHSQYKNFMLFFTSKVLDIATARIIAPDMLATMKAKVGRRCCKLKASTMPFVTHSASNAVTAANLALENSLCLIQSEETTEIPPLTPPTYEDTALSLRKSREYLQDALSRLVERPDVAPFQPESIDRMRLNKKGLPHLVVAGDVLDRVITLADVERWIKDHLSSWFKGPKSCYDCTALATLIRAYIKVAQDEYRVAPEELSLALLTIVELWVVLDKICVSLHPLLGTFGPGIPSTILEPLLLPKISQMRRLRAIEEYIECRMRDSSRRNPSIFADPQRLSFAVQYYDTSEKHQRLKTRIEADAHARRSDKETEWEQKTENYRSLKLKASILSHEIQIDEDDDRIHLSSCRKCRLERQYESISIKPDEWPLPGNAVMAKAAVFELDCPEAIIAWRDATWTILHDLGRVESISGQNSELRLLKYDLLKPYALNRGQRLTLASTTKSFLQAHYRDFAFPVDKKAVCVNNGLRYRLIDNEVDIWTQDQTAQPSIARMCMTKLPTGPYSNLQDTVDSHVHTQNEIIARQETCSKNLNIMEFIAFGSLRSGERIQWINILRELGSANLSFNEPAVAILIMQAAWQAGSVSGMEERRTSHRAFLDRYFCLRLLKLLERLHAKIEANWKEQEAMSILIAISLRLVSLTLEQTIKDRAIYLLRQARHTTIRWCRNLDTMLNDSGNDNKGERTRLLILKAASLCRLTYDLDAEDIETALNSDDDVANFVESAVLIRDNTPDPFTSLTNELQRCIIHGWKVAQGLEDRLHNLIQDRSDGIDQAIRQIWSEAVMSGQWTFMPGKDRSWAFNKTLSTLYGEPQSVHYNIISGELLVDGRPLGRIPRSFTKHPLYQRLFGSRILRVFASDMPGMWYMTARPLQQYHVHMGMIDGQLLIRIRDGENVLEIVPHKKFEGDLPFHFRENFAHWLNLQTGVIELRPLSDIWSPSTDNWQLLFSSTAASSMSQVNRRLVDIRSQSRRQIVKVLLGLDDGDNIHVTRMNDGMIEVELMRLNIRFFINGNGELESKELGAVVDLDQSLNTLHGLNNRLVLRDKVSDRRSVLVPHGNVVVTKHQEHVKITIDTSRKSRVRYFRYTLDPHLRKLRGPYGMQSELYLCYLHALSSFPLPDDFTGRTGTEEALTILRGESLRGFSPLEVETQNLLRKISQLTPKREFYPPHLQVMQQVSWNMNLNQLSQHDEFNAAVKDIIAHTNQFAMLYAGTKAFSFKDKSSMHLLARASQRHSTFRAYEFGGDAMNGALDKVYVARDREADSARGRRVYEIASLIQRWPSQLNVTTDLARMIRDWGYVSGYEDQLDQRCFGDLIDLSFPKTWGSLYNLCRSSRRERDLYNLMFLFCPVAFGQADSPMKIRTLLAFAFSDAFRDMPAPQHPTFNLNNDCPIHSTLEQALRSCRRPFVTEQSRFVNGSQKDIEWKRDKRSTYDRELSNQIRLCQNSLVSQWPCRYPSLPSEDLIPLIDRGSASHTCDELYAEWYKNHEFKIHIEKAQNLLTGMWCQESRSYRPGSQIVEEPPQPPRRKLPSLSDLFGASEVPVLGNRPPPLTCKRNSVPNAYQCDYGELDSIIAGFESSSDPIQEEYGRNLRGSFKALTNDVTAEVPLGIPFELGVLTSYRTHLRQHVDATFAAITASLRPRSNDLEIVKAAGLWPSITPQTLLAPLSGVSPSRLDPQWKQTLLGFGEAINMLQRAERLVRLAEQQDVLGFYKESENVGREGWAASKYPTWLLMEIENDFTIRAIQARVAIEMIRPMSGRNSVLQLNMGEGKSSVIIPMVAVVLADQCHLSRVITLKPLLRQTTYLLSQRLGGLVNRRLYHTPFSRKTTLNQEVVQGLQTIFEQCRHRRGIFLALPEHLLSFRLMGRERLLNDRSLAKHLLETGLWLQQHARDVLDESDEILDTRSQLVYTVGFPRMLDGQPDRWTVTQAVLTCIDKHIDAISQTGGVEVKRKIGSFPAMTFLREDAGHELIELVITDIVQGHVPAISLGHCGPRILAAIRKFIQLRDVDDDAAALIQATFGDSSHMATLLLLRGLFAHQILLFALRKKRWLVEYGLDPRRCLMAVPYRAKGVPSLSSEFGHPDVAVLLTCLSYYYTGMTHDQLYRCLDLILKEPDPTHEYAGWTRASLDLPDELKDLDGINIEDEDLCVRLFSHLKYNKAVADFFLSRVVFPQEGKEFLTKISSSGWDIPAPEGGHPTTGFSGTNDNRFLLPLSIEQRDLPDLHGTNAGVLNILLRAENRQYISAKDEDGKRLSVQSLIRCIASQTPAINVLIDVGAQVLEMRNREVVEEWLTYDTHAMGGVFFDVDDEALILHRDGRVERLISSSFNNNLDGFIIYYDEAHARGVDLKLPTKARAAVTLGACNRMRKLGSGQSLVFLGSPDLERSIRNCLRVQDGGQLDSGSVVRWTLQKTCELTESVRPLWVMQGVASCRRRMACQVLVEGDISIAEAMSDEARVTRFWEDIQESEALSLERMYGLRNDAVDPFLGYDRGDTTIQKLVQVWNNLGRAVIRDSSVHGEHVREISHEVQRVRQVQRPPPATPLRHSLHPDVIYYTTHGIFPPAASTFKHAFATMQDTSAGQFLDSGFSMSDVFVTEDFVNVVKGSKNFRRDEYLRPVHWILSSTKTKEIILISPYEADQLITPLESQSVVRLHVYAPRVTKTMVSFETLRFHTIPACLVEPAPPEASLYRLGLFAGSLYTRDFSAYKGLCSLLGITTSVIDDNEHINVSVDRFVDRAGRDKLGWSIDCPFDKCPIPFLKALTALRRKGQGHKQSHIGSIISGKILTEDSFS